MDGSLKASALNWERLGKGVKMLVQEKYRGGGLQETCSLGREGAQRCIGLGGVKKRVVILYFIFFPSLWSSQAGGLTAGAVDSGGRVGTRGMGYPWFWCAP